MTSYDLCMVINPALRDVISAPDEVSQFLQTSIQDILLDFGLNTLTQQNKQRRLFFDFIKEQGLLPPEKRAPFVNEVLKIYPMDIPRPGESRKYNKIVTINSFVTFVEHVRFDTC
eukprot:TRINITY_DN2363_c0_g1_i2.p1 TRINITY_DN2363_c0_g1~~TRINITY_DN2363_c0_g1_i2.p1  ORF type:complete len:128 (-),score=20.40 TRINITY_DN2363_c0_g1_i2:412-756(-)